MRTFVYVDGFNLFYGSLKGRPNKWLDLCALFDRVLPQGLIVERVKYFTARVSALPHNQDAPNRQDVYIRALRGHLGSRIEVIEGHFTVKATNAPSANDPAQKVRILKTEEKGSDVNLAVELLNDAWLDCYDCAVVVSNDADLASAMRLVKQQRQKHVVLCTPGAPDRKPMAVLSKWSHRQIGIFDQDAAACQLPSPTQGGLFRPADW